MYVRITTNLLIFIHILVVLYTILYGICVKNNKYDYIYLAYIYFLLLHWTFLNSIILFKKNTK